MERVKKAIEKAKAERETLGRRHLAVEALVAAPEPVVHVPPDLQLAAETDPVDRTGQFQAAREATLDSEHLRKGRLLAPGMEGPTAGAFKMLRTQVLQRMRSRGWNTLAVVSATPSEGKTTVAINLAMAISMDPGHSALLVDFDLRHPSVARRLGLDPDPGVEDCLVGRCPVNDALVRLTGYDRLTILPARAPVLHSSELLGSEPVRFMVADLKARYPDRFVLFDLPPLLGSDDALAFAPLVDALLVVVAEGQTRTDELLRSFELIKDRPVVGTVLNRSRGGAEADYYGY